MRRYRNEILAEWRRAVRDLPVARDMNAVTLVDHIPAVLEEIAEVAEELGRHDTAEPPVEAARRHALDRLAEGFDIWTVVRELSLLRGCMLAVWGRAEVSGTVAELRVLNLAIDHAITASVGRFAEVHQRTLESIDRISTASLESTNVDDLLQRMLVVFMETTPAVDTAAIFLCEGGRLQLRATVGLEEDRARGFSLAVGEGFAGTIAADRKPRQLSSAYLDPLLVSDVLRERGIRALYGVPLLHDDRVIGVAYMGSRTATELSHEDRQLFGSMAARATIGILQHTLAQELAASEARHKQLANERERALAKLESLLAASPVGIGFVDRDLRYIRINEALASLNGRSASEHIGRTVAEVRPDAASTLEPMLRRVLETGEPILNSELSVPASTRAVLANYFPVRSSQGVVTGVGAVVIDVTETKRAQEALRIEQARVQSILEHAPAAIWVKDVDGRVVLANHRLADSLGVRYDDMIGRRTRDLLAPEVAREHESHDEIVMREQRSIEVEESVPSPDGERTYLAVKFPIPGDPPLVGGIATEITARKRIEEELRIAVRTREDMLAIVSHDLRNPVGTVQLSANLLLGHLGADHRARRHLEIIGRSCLRMEHLIDDLLDIASIREGRLQLDTKPEDAESVMSEAFDLQQPVADEKGITLVRERDLHGMQVLCDRDRVLQVFGNLIGNAIKFCRAGDTITVKVEHAGDDVVYSVADTGPGIKPDVLPHLFDPYWSASEHKKHGSGLGLYIARGIVDGHGGRMWIESEVGKGATFFFTLPVAK